VLAFNLLVATLPLETFFPEHCGPMQPAKGFLLKKIGCCTCNVFSLTPENRP